MKTQAEVAAQQQLVPLGPVRSRPSTRREGDRYYTPEWVTSSFLRHFPEVQGGTLYDPCCGDGSMARQIYEAGACEIRLCNDIDPRQTQAHRHEDATQEQTWIDADRPDLVVTNPPFRAAEPIARHALQHARVAVALLLRITWLEPCASRTWLTALPPTRLLVLPRISFTGQGVDSATCAWFVWLRGPEGAWQRGSILLATREESAGQTALLLEARR